MHIVQWIVFCFSIFGALGGVSFKRKDGHGIQLSGPQGIERLACAFVAYIVRPW